VKEIRVHGRGGQGAVLAARMLATFFVMRGNHVASFPMYGFERRGAPVVAFTRVDDEPIKEKMQIYNPDCLLVIDPGLMTLQGLFDGLKPDGVLVLNSPDGLEDRPNPNLKLLGYVDATNIAVEEIGRDVPNTCLLGALAAATGWLDMESIAKGLCEYFDGDLLERNINSAKRGFEEVKIKKW
jgi:2-oxoacid:acceptor oxidoreductase gamma subunit (pyruvate/2-ketoisovalerate family)